MEYENIETRLNSTRLSGKHKSASLRIYFPPMQMHLAERYAAKDRFRLRSIITVIDLFSLGDLLSHFRPWDNPLENCFFQIFK